MSRIKDKIKELKGYLNELELVLPENFEKYLKHLEKRLACERAFEKIMESANDLAIIFLKEKRFELPNEEIRAFETLSDKGIISQDLAEKLRQAKGMRNFLAHQYGDIDDKMIFDAIRNKIVLDITNFLEKINDNLK